MVRTRKTEARAVINGRIASLDLQWDLALQRFKDFATPIIAGPDRELTAAEVRTRKVLKAAIEEIASECERLIAVRDGKSHLVVVRDDPAPSLTSPRTVQKRQYVYADGSPATPRIAEYR